MHGDYSLLGGFPFFGEEITSGVVSSIIIRAENCIGLVHWDWSDPPVCCALDYHSSVGYDILQRGLVEKVCLLIQNPDIK